jgi:hypothetical protein
MSSFNYKCNNCINDCRIVKDELDSFRCVLCNSIFCSSCVKFYKNYLEDRFNHTISDDLYNSINARYLNKCVCKKCNNEMINKEVRMAIISSGPPKVHYI